MGYKLRNILKYSTTFRGTARDVQLELADRAMPENDWIVTITQASLAASCGRSPRSVQDAIPKLIAGGVIEMVANHGRGRSTSYRIVIPEVVQGQLALTGKSAEMNRKIRGDEPENPRSRAAIRASRSSSSTAAPQFAPLRSVPDLPQDPGGREMEIKTNYDEALWIIAGRRLMNRRADGEQIQSAQLWKDKVVENLRKEYFEKHLDAPPDLDPEGLADWLTKGDRLAGYARIPEPIKGCRECVGGWIENPNGDVRPCPRCLPGRATIG